MEEIVEAPMAGKITRVHVKAGDKINEGDVLLIIEALKMENPILAPVSGVMKELRISEGQFIKAGEAMAIIETWGQG